MEKAFQMTANIVVPIGKVKMDFDERPVQMEYLMNMNYLK